MDLSLSLSQWNITRMFYAGYGISKSFLSVTDRPVWNRKVSRYRNNIIEKSRNAYASTRFEYTSVCIFGL